MKQLLNQQALVASLEGAYTWASEGGPLFCLAERTSRRRSGELSKAVQILIVMELKIMTNVFFFNVHWSLLVRNHFYFTKNCNK